MSRFKPKDFDEVLNTVENSVEKMVECDYVGSIGGNLNTRGMSFKDRDNPHMTGTIIVGEDKDAIAVDISLLDGEVRSFRLEDSADRDGISNIIGWFEENYGNG